MQGYPNLAIKQSKTTVPFIFCDPSHDLVTLGYTGPVIQPDKCQDTFWALICVPCEVMYLSTRQVHDIRSSKSA